MLCSVGGSAEQPYVTEGIQKKNGFQKYPELIICMYNPFQNKLTTRSEEGKKYIVYKKWILCKDIHQSVTAVIMESEINQTGKKDGF